MIVATPQTVRTIGTALDHPESICCATDGTLYCGGEAGQIYRIRGAARQDVVGITGGNVLGVALDGRERIYACDYWKRTVFRVDQAGAVTPYTRGTNESALSFPNAAVFDRAGNLFVSDSGDYWNPDGTGRIFLVRANGPTIRFHDGPFRFANGIAIDPRHEWLYVAQSAAHTIVRIPLSKPNGTIEHAYALPNASIPDGIAFAEDGRLIVGCYKPDSVLICHPGGEVETLIDDPTGELLLRPTGIALCGNQLFIANLGGYHITVIDTDMRPAPVYRPLL